jgi:DNA-directed RNA polymerase specialized sigma24 family protein
MTDILALKEVEKIIEKVASRFTIDGADFEDLIQIGRIGVWKLLEKHDINEENLSQHKGLIWTTVDFALKNELTKSKAQKRFNLSNADSLDESFDEDDVRTLHDVLSAKEESSLDALEDRETAKELLKKLERKSLVERTSENKRAVMWLLIHILGIDRKDISKKITYATFVQYKLQRWLWIFFNNSPFRAINCAYPGEFLPHQMQKSPQRQWKGKRGRKRAIEVLKTILSNTGYASENFPKLITYKFFEEFKITTPLCKIFGWNRFEYLNAAFPDQFQPWELSVTPRDYFESLENTVKAVKWLIEEKLGYKMGELTVQDIWREHIDLRVTKQVFSDYGLREIMANYRFPEPILRLVYPDKFLPWSFQRKGKWTGEKGKELAAKATRWVIEEYAKICPTSAMIDCNFFRENGLWGMLTAKSAGFNTSPKRALKNAYPEINFN